LADHAEDLLSEAGAGLVGAHLDECAGCRINALLLALLREILAADDPGPMPARHAARIEVTLAELAITEPVLSAELVAARQARPRLREPPTAVVAPRFSTSPRGAR